MYTAVMEINEVELRMSGTLEPITAVSGMRLSGGRWWQHWLACVVPAGAVRLAIAGATGLVIGATYSCLCTQ